MRSTSNTTRRNAMRKYVAGSLLSAVIAYVATVVIIRKFNQA